jgi:hypothetical protein
VSYGGRIGYPNDVWDGSLAFMEVPKNTNPVVGFVPRRDFRRYQPQLRYNPRPHNHPYIRRFSFGGDFDIYTDMQNRATTQEFDFTATRVELHSGDNVDFSVVPSYERLEEPFTIASGITLPAGAEYRFTRLRVSANTANKRIVSVQPRVEWGRFLSGHRRELAMGVGLRPRPGVTMNLAYELNDVNLAEGKFETRLYRMVADTQFSPLRLGKPRAWVAVTVPMDFETGQRHLLRLHAQLARSDRPRIALRDARPPRCCQSGLYETLLTFNRRKKKEERLVSSFFLLLFTFVHPRSDRKSTESAHRASVDTR